MVEAPPARVSAPGPPLSSAAAARTASFMMLGGRPAGLPEMPFSRNARAARAGETAICNQNLAFRVLFSEQRENTSGNGGTQINRPRPMQSRLVSLRKCHPASTAASCHPRFDGYCPKAPSTGTGKLIGSANM